MRKKLVLDDLNMVGTELPLDLSDNLLGLFPDKVDTTLHGLRSEYISLGYKYKADAKAITESAGHHSEQFSRDVYQAVFDEMKHELASSIDEALYSPAGEPDDGHGNDDVVKNPEKVPALHIHYNG